MICNSKQLLMFHFMDLCEKAADESQNRFRLIPEAFLGGAVSIISFTCEFLFVQRCHKMAATSSSVRETRPADTSTPRLFRLEDRKK